MNGDEIRREELFIVIGKTETSVSTKQWVKRNSIFCGTVVVAQLVKRTLPIPEVHSSYPVIGKIY